MIPGMERRITEHYLFATSDVLTTASEQSNRSLQEIPLLKGSFGHTSHTGGRNPVPNDSSEESLYGMDRAMGMSESANSVIGLTRSASSHEGYATQLTKIPVTAEIACPTPPPPAVPLMTAIPPPMSTMTSTMAITSPTLTMSREELIRHQPHTGHHYQQKENGVEHEPTSVSQVY